MKNGMELRYKPGIMVAFRGSSRVCSALGFQGAHCSYVCHTISPDYIASNFARLVEVPR